jgi:hypothetical protein
MPSPHVRVRPDVTAPAACGIGGFSAVATSLSADLARWLPGPAAEAVAWASLADIVVVGLSGLLVWVPDGKESAGFGRLRCGSTAGRDWSSSDRCPPSRRPARQAPLKTRDRDWMRPEITTHDDPIDAVAAAIGGSG